MDDPKEIWWFDRWFASRPITGPHKVIRNKKHLWVVIEGQDMWHVPKEDAYPTKNEALLAHYKFNERRIIKEHKNTDEKMRLLKKYYSEELDG